MASRASDAAWPSPARPASLPKLPCQPGARAPRLNLSAAAVGVRQLLVRSCFVRLSVAFSSCCSFQLLFEHEAFCSSSDGPQPMAKDANQLETFLRVCLCVSRYPPAVRGRHFTHLRRPRCVRAATTRILKKHARLTGSAIGARDVNPQAFGKRRSPDGAPRAALVGLRAFRLCWGWCSPPCRPTTSWRTSTVKARHHLLHRARHGSPMIPPEPQGATRFS